MTALHHVVILGLYPSARFLLEYGADVSVADKVGIVCEFSPEPTHALIAHQSRLVGVMSRTWMVGGRESQKLIDRN